VVQPDPHSKTPRQVVGYEPDYAHQDDYSCFIGLSHVSHQKSMLHSYEYDKDAKHGIGDQRQDGQGAPVNEQRQRKQ